MGDSPKKIAQRIIRALDDIGNATYSHPAHGDKPASSRPTTLKNYFDSMQKEARYIKRSLEQNPEPNPGSQQTISGKFRQMKSDYAKYEQVYIANNRQSDLRDLMNAVNGSAGYWAELLRALQ